MSRRAYPEFDRNGRRRIPAKLKFVQHNLLLVFGSPPKGHIRPHLSNQSRPKRILPLKFQSRVIPWRRHTAGCNDAVSLLPVESKDLALLLPRRQQIFRSNLLGFFFG